MVARSRIERNENDVQVGQPSAKYLFGGLMDVATRSAWKTLSPPRIFESLQFEGTFSDGEYLF